MSSQPLVVRRPRPYIENLTRIGKWRKRFNRLTFKQADKKCRPILVPRRESISVRRPHGTEDVAGCIMGNRMQTAAVRVDGPDLIRPRPVAVERDLLPIGREARHTIREILNRELSFASAIHASHVKVFLFT